MKNPEQPSSYMYLLKRVVKYLYRWKDLFVPVMNELQCLNLVDILIFTVRMSGRVSNGSAVAGVFFSCKMVCFTCSLLIWVLYSLPQGMIA